MGGSRSTPVDLEAASAKRGHCDDERPEVRSLPLPSGVLGRRLHAPAYADVRRSGSRGGDRCAVPSRSAAEPVITPPSLGDRDSRDSPRTRRHRAGVPSYISRPRAGSRTLRSYSLMIRSSVAPARSGAVSATVRPPVFSRSRRQRTPGGRRLARVPSRTEYASVVMSTDGPRVYVQRAGASRPHRVAWRRHTRLAREAAACGS